jgi:hypothetical protein
MLDYHELTGWGTLIMEHASYHISVLTRVEEVYGFQVQEMDTAVQIFEPFQRIKFSYK